MTDDAPVLLKPAQVAKELQVDRRTVYTWLRNGMLRGSKVGLRGWRITRADLSAFHRSNGPLKAMS
jgi:excisionase family DNA binding protein